MVNTKLIQYNLDSGDFETLFSGEKQHTKPEYVVKKLDAFVVFAFSHRTYPCLNKERKIDPSKTVLNIL